MSKFCERYVYKIINKIIKYCTVCSLILYEEKKKKIFLEKEN